MVFDMVVSLDPCAWAHGSVVVRVHAGSDEDFPQAVLAPDAIPKAECAQVSLYVEYVSVEHGESPFRLVVLQV